MAPLRLHFMTTVPTLTGKLVGCIISDVPHSKMPNAASNAHWEFRVETSFR